MNIFFDMDYTILSATGRLRPEVMETFNQLREDGHSLYIWSGIGVRVAEVRNLGLLPLVQGVYEKPVQDYQRMLEGMLRRGELPTSPDLVVDDYPEVVSALGGVSVRPYVNDDPEDREMARVYEAIHQRVSIPLDSPTSGSGG